MIKISEIIKDLEEIDSSFEKGFPRNTFVKVKELQDRLVKEVTGTCTDIDLTFMELKNNLLEYNKQNFGEFAKRLRRLL